MPRHALPALESRAIRPSAIPAGVLAVALVASACAATASPLPKPSGPIPPVTSFAPSSPAVPRPTTQPTAAPSVAVVSALPESGNWLFPGRYRTNFQPAVELTIDREVNVDCAPGYRCRGDVDVNVPTWLDLEFGHDHPIDISLMRFEQLYDPTRADRLIKPPTDLAAWIAAWPGLTVTNRKAVRIGGVDATQLDVQAGDSDVPLGPSGLADPPALGFGAHQLRRLTIMRVDGSAIFIQIGSVNAADETPARLAAAIDILQPIVDSITWQ